MPIRLLLTRRATLMGGCALAASTSMAVPANARLFPDIERRLGIRLGVAVVTYGVWRALAWMLGVREDWPLHTAWHQAAEIPRERPHMSVPKQQRDTDAWRAADQASRDQAQRDALRYWQHVRALADKTGTA